MPDSPIITAIQFLQQQRDRIDAAIRQLEELMGTRLVPTVPTIVPQGKRRGRKFMNAEERAEVSRRMRRYWAKRRSASA